MDPYSNPCMPLQKCLYSFPLALMHQSVDSRTLLRQFFIRHLASLQVPDILGLSWENRKEAGKLLDYNRIYLYICKNWDLGQENGNYYRIFVNISGLYRGII